MEKVSLICRCNRVIAVMAKCVANGGVMLRLWASLMAVIAGLAACSLVPLQKELADGDRTRVLPLDPSVDALLQRMTLEQKVGQMAMLATFMFFKEENGVPVIDEEKLDQALNRYKIGAFVNSPASPTSVALWHQWLTALQTHNQNQPYIPALVGTDSIHGASFTQNAVLLPQNIALAASRNIDNARQAARITATDTATTGVYWNFGPVLDIGRNPVWPRFEETFGESTLLVGDFGRAMTEAYEQVGVASAVKHFVGYSASEQGIDRAPAFLSDLILQRYHLPPFKQAIEAGASTVMLNSASINGIPTHANPALLQGVLREQWGFEGVIASDWADIRNLHDRHRIAKDTKEALALAVAAGVDLVMVPTDFQFCDELVALVNEGRVAESRIDESVRRILRLKQHLGLFGLQWSLEQKEKQFADNRPIHQAAARQLARESITLLKNHNHILPLSKSAKVLLVGPTIDVKSPLHGAWSYSWQGADENAYPESVQTLAQAFQQRFGNHATIWKGAIKKEDQSRFQQAATNADVIVLALGEGAYAEQVGTIDDLNLPAEQKALIRAAKATGKPVVAILAMGRPRLISDVEPLLDGVVMAYRLGNFGAEAIADVLIGDVNPAGILPFSYPKFPNNILPFDHLTSASFRHRDDKGTQTDGYQPQWPFGFGLSYTDFAVTGLTVTPTTFKAGDTISIQFKVTNTGSRSGAKAIDIFSRDHIATLSPVVRQHIGYTRVELEPSKSQTVSFAIPAESLGYRDAKGEQVLEAGAFSIVVDALTQDIQCVD